MDLITYIEHMLTCYEMFFTKLDELYTKASIINFDSNGTIRMHGFCLGDQPNVLYLRVTKKVYSYHERDNVEKEVYLPVEKMVLFNRYTFDGGNIVAQNEDALNEAIELVNSSNVLAGGLDEKISFYNGTTRFSIEPNLEKGNEYVKISRYYGEYNKDYLSDHITFFFKERRFETIDDSSLTYNLKDVKIPEEKIPAYFKKLYENRNLYIRTLTDEELIIHNIRKKDEKEYYSKKHGDTSFYQEGLCKRMLKYWL